MTKAAIKATFADWRTVKGRKVLQLVFEVPLEQQGEVLSMLGAPMPDEATWCGIALLASQGEPAEREAGACLGGPDPGPPLPRAKTVGERARIRAVMLCNDARFKRWANAMDEDEETVAGQLRAICGIKSRSQIATNPNALRRFLALETQYLIETGQMAEPR